VSDDEAFVAAIEQYLHWHRAGLTHDEMLAAVGDRSGGAHSAWGVVLRLQIALLELHEQPRRAA
jgi:hypothetical protein